MTMTAQMRRRIRERWEELSGILTAEAKRTSSSPADLVNIWCDTHTRRVVQLLHHGVRLRKIRQHGWDDPRATSGEFAENLEAAISNLCKRNRTVPPLGLAKFRRTTVPSNPEDPGDEK